MSPKEYLELSVLDKARYERTLWDKELKKHHPNDRMSVVLARKFGTPVQEIAARSNLLRLGTANPENLALWEQIERGEISSQEAYQRAKANPRKKPKATKRSSNGSPTNASSTVSNLAQRASKLELQAQTLQDQVRRLLDDIENHSEPFQPKAFKGDLKGLYTRVRDLIYEELRAQEYIKANLSDLSEATRYFLISLDESFRELNDSLERSRGKKQTIVTSVGEIQKAFKTLGLKYRPNFAFEEVHRAYRRLAAETHPDRLQSAPDSFLRINEAYRCIKTYYERKNVCPTRRR